MSGLLTCVVSKNRMPRFYVIIFLISQSCLVACVMFHSHLQALVDLIYDCMYIYTSLLSMLMLR